MKRPSRNSVIKVTSAAAAAASAATASNLITKKPGASALLGVTVGLIQTSSLIGDLRIGKELSKTKQEVIKQGLALEKMSAALKEISARNPVKTPNPNAKKNKNETSKEAAPAVVQKPTPQHPISDLKLSPAANLQSRRTGAPLKEIPPKKESLQRAYAPIQGEDAKSWVASRTGGAPFVTPETHPFHRTSAVPFAHEIPVAIIADDFTFHSFKSEFEAHRLTPNNWRTVFEKHQPQLFFCESAWQGGSPKEHPWQGKIYASVRWPKENRGVLLEILDYCHKNHIPTVFWNKEDPTHFGDRVNDFIRTAALFDYVFTTAEECLPNYRKDVAVNHIDVLPFAVQPKLFNPQGISTAKPSVNFAGTWYVNYPARCEAASVILDQVIENDLDLIIYDRMYGSKGPNYKYPAKYAPYTHPAIPYNEIPGSYKKSQFGITLNTVTDSPTMFARRAFELAASGAVVLSNYAEGVHNFFGDSVIYADRDTDHLKSLSAAEYRRLQRGAMNISLQNTYTHRAEKILDTVGITYQSSYQKPSGLVTVSTEAEYETAHSNFLQNDSLENLLVVTTKDAEQSLETLLFQARDKNVTILNQRSLQENEYRTRSFLSSPSVITADESKNWMDESKIEELLLHTSHFEGGISFSANDSGRYEVTSSSLQPDLLIPSSKVTKIFNPEEKISVFQI